MNNCLIGIDLDGTLLTPNKKITRTTYDVLVAAINKGNYIVPVTGRPLSGLPQELVTMLGIRYAILNNGAVTYDYANNSIIYDNKLKKESVIDIYNVISLYNVIFEAFIDGFGYENNESISMLTKRFKSNPIMDYIYKSRKIVPDIYEYLLQNISNIDGISIMSNNAIICSSIRKLLEAIEDVNIVSPTDCDLEINSKSAGKGNALMALGNRLGISKDHIIAIGDSDNDIQMLKMSGISIAMGNSSAKVKKISSYVTADNSHDGVAAAIKKIVL